MRLDRPPTQTPTRVDRWIETIESTDDVTRHRSLENLCAGCDLSQLLDAADSLDRYWRSTHNLYHRVRALFFLAALYRYYIPAALSPTQVGLIPFDAYQHMLGRRFHEAIDGLLRAQNVASSDQSPSTTTKAAATTSASATSTATTSTPTATSNTDDVASRASCLAIASGLAKAYYQLGFQTLADQVRQSVRTVRGNQWMFRIGDPNEQPLRVVSPLLVPDAETGQYPILVEKTSVRMDFSHSGWSDIFFLGMDFPEGARVINASIDLAVHGRDPFPRPPVEGYLRVIDRPVMRLVSIDLGAEAEIAEVDEIFDFAKDYLGLLKAAVIASGVVPPAMEGCHRPMSELLHTLLGRSGLGLEIVSQVNDIPKGSRLAVSTNLLGCLIAVLMRATGQVSQLVNGLREPDRRLVAARAILGEWMGGSGGGWQDSGGVWPGIKLIHGCLATEDDPEWGISRGRLLPQHEPLDASQISEATRQKLQDSLILVHGGMAQNVGPILEMVTEKYLIRGEREWAARKQAIDLLDRMLTALAHGDVREVGRLTTENFRGPLQTIIPWCTNRFTDTLIEKCERRFGEQFWGFLMLGGMSGGGMGFIFDPIAKPSAQAWLKQTLLETKLAMQKSLPFAMDPVIYDFAINDRGSWSTLLNGEQAVMPNGYYGIVTPRWIRQELRELSPQTQRELIRLGAACRDGSAAGSWLLDRILPRPRKDVTSNDSLADLLQANGFDREQHEQIRADLISGRIGLAQNRLPSQTRIEDIPPGAIIDTRLGPDTQTLSIGRAAITSGQVGVMTLAAGVGSRWTGGAGVVKGLHPFCKFDGRHRSFIEIHLAKSRRANQTFNARIPHIFTTGYLTHQPIQDHLRACNNYGYKAPIYLSPGMSVGLRTIPTERDLRFFWEEMPQQVLDEQQQKVRESLRAALIGWAHQHGEAADYTDNLPMQCMHPVGHWYEFPNLLRNGLLCKILREQPSLRYLMLHNIDTLGASIDPDILGRHIVSGSTLSFEVIGRRIEDRGGGLAIVDGRRRLLEGLAMPREEDEFGLTFYNSMTTWIDIDRLLSVFALTRDDLENADVVDRAVRRLAQRLPTYITIKDVKKRWGNGQEDIYPVAQFEKLWGDMTALPEVACEFIAVETARGQQLKDPAQLDPWSRDGSAEYVRNLCAWDGNRLKA